MHETCIAIALLFMAVMIAGITSSIIRAIESILDRQRIWTNKEHALLVMTIRQVK